MSVVRMRGYPKWFYNLLLISFAFLILTGLGLIPNALLFRLDWDITWAWPGDERLWIVAAHAAVAFLVVSQLGALWSVHMRIGWRHRKNLNSGLGMTAVLLSLVLTGVGIYYLGDKLSVTASMLHIVIGLTLPGLFVYHIIAGRTRYKIHQN